MSAKDKSGGKTKKRAQRATSNVFAMFEQSQIQEFKEAFTMIDQDRDGFIGKEDLTDTFASLGRAPKDADIEAMLSEAPGPINFTMFLTLFGDKISGTDPEEVIKSAFKMFDTENTGKIGDDVLRDILMNMGERFTKEEVDQAYNGAPITKGMVDYVQFARIMTKGTDDEPPK